jgi:hypothetical protein
MRIGTWALDIFLKSNYIESIARSNRLPGFLTSRTQLALVIAGPRSAKQLQIDYRRDVAPLILQVLSEIRLR